MSSSARRNSTALKPPAMGRPWPEKGPNTTEEEQEEEEEEEECGPICSYMYDYARQYPSSLRRDSEAFPGE
jgi:hypothetical protein